MGHERRKATVCPLKSHLQNVFADCAGAEAVRRRDAWNCALDVREQLRVRREWPNLERALPGPNEVLCRHVLAI